MRTVSGVWREWVGCWVGGGLSDVGQVVSGLVRTSWAGKEVVGGRDKSDHDTVGRP
jgi:hypothetical protein